jgi:hypothetical protein
MDRADTDRRSTVAGCYASNEEMEARWRRLADLHGGSCDTLGHSREGRPILGWRFPAVGASQNPADDSPRPSSATSIAAPSLLFVSLLHPMEWIGRSTHLRLLESMLAASPGRARPSLLSIPVANPDGAARVEEGLRASRFRWVRGNAAGVDLNRNFPIAHRRRPRWVDWWPMWNPGPSPASEPETAAMCAWVEKERPVVAISFHSFGRWFFYPPGASRRKEESAAAHARCAADATATVGAATMYRSAQLGRWAFWFRAYGTEIDCFARHGALSFLVEVSRGGFGQWPTRRMLHPFSIFNPPDPEPEIALLLPSLLRLLEAAVQEAEASQPLVP